MDNTIKTKKIKKISYLSILVFIFGLTGILVVIYSCFKDNEKESFFNYLSQIEYIKNNTEGTYLPKKIYFNDKEINIKYENKNKIIVVNNYKEIANFDSNKYCNKEFNHVYTRNIKKYEEKINIECKDNNLYIQINIQ